MCNMLIYMQSVEECADNVYEYTSLQSFATNRFSIGQCLMLFIHERQDFAKIKYSLKLAKSPDLDQEKSNQSKPKKI